MNDTPDVLQGKQQTQRVVAQRAPNDTPLPEIMSDPAQTSGRSVEPSAAGAASAKPEQTVASSIPAALREHPRYEILGRLGSGGMGTVYKARHRLMERLVALKVINPALVGWPEAVRRFRQEIRLAARLSHPNIVTAYDAEQAGDTHFLVMEFVEGIALDRVVAAQGPLSIERACDYVRQAAHGLQHAHEGGMVHRDIKPHNLILTPADAVSSGGGLVKILDFGLARFASEVPLTRTESAPPAVAEPVDPQSGDADSDSSLAPTRLRPAGAESGSVDTGMGTPDYLAPEEGENANRADIRGDIYSLGCTLYYLLAGQVPFPGGTPVEKLRAHRERTPWPLPELRGDVPATVAHVVERMMARDPEQRYQTPSEAARALAPFAAPLARHVLVVDDNAALREVMSAALESEGYRVSLAGDGREALEALHRGPLPDLILLDMMMPGMDGWEFLRKRRHEPALAAIPVLVVSALDEDQARDMALGVAGHLQKPVELDVLGDAIRKHTAQG